MMAAFTRLCALLLVVVVSPCVGFRPRLSARLARDGLARDVGRQVRAASPSRQVRLQEDPGEKGKLPAAGEERRASTEPAFKATDILSALPYAIGLVAFSFLALSQGGYLDSWKPFGDFEIPAEWLQDS